MISKITASQGCYKIFLIFFLLLVKIPIYADKYTSVKDLGDIWVVTIDKSGSMLHGTTPSVIANDVSSRLLRCSSFNSVDFSKDRFIFLTSGYSFSVEKGLGNELSNSLPFDQSFIHPIDNQLHKFESAQDFAKYLRNIMTHSDYSHQLSFVSQIRLFSIVHAVNYLKQHNKTDTFDKLMILTITDDADQNDQWMMDYRLLKTCAANKVQEVNDSTTKYIYNSINGKGLGNLDNIYSDDLKMPHIWIYRYQTLASSVACKEVDILKVHATDGKELQIDLKYRTYDDDEISFVHIDSVKINDTVLAIDSSFDGRYKGRHTYDNTFKTNKVAIYGYVQVGYTDPIYGAHYKIIPFVQYESVVSNALATLYNRTLTIVILFVILLAVYFFVIRPNTVLFTICTGTGKKIVVKRGFGFDWPGEIVPILCYETIDNDLNGCIIKHHKNISVKDFNLNNLSLGNECLIISHNPIDISIDVKSISTSEDIEDVYFVRSGLYPRLLRAHYEITGFYKLYKQYHSTHNRWVRKFLKFILGCKNYFGELYYYSFPQVDKSQKVYFGYDTIFKTKRFLIEYEKLSKEVPCNIYTKITNSALSHYYTHQLHAVYDVIVASYTTPEEIYWTIIKTNTNGYSNRSLRDVALFERFRELSPVGNAQDGFMLIVKYLQKVFKTKKIAHIEVNDLSWDFSFKIEKSTAPGFISFKESCDNPRAQIFYSPINDFERTEKFITINPKYCSGHLVLSPAPVEVVVNRASFVVTLSKTVIANDIKTSNLLTISDDGFEFRNINKKF